jgi:hypothetical protein
MRAEDVKIGMVVKCTNVNGVTLVGRVKGFEPVDPRPGVPPQPVLVDFSETEGEGAAATWGYEEIEPTDLPLGTFTEPTNGG